MNDYREYIKHFIGKADESVEVARAILRDNHAEFGVARAYYAMFYAAEAALLSKELQYKKHSAVIANFNKEFVKTGIFPNETAKTRKKAFDFRMQGDYSIVPIEPEKAQAVLEGAAEFVVAVKEYLKKEGYWDS